MDTKPNKFAVHLNDSPAFGWFLNEIAILREGEAKYILGGSGGSWSNYEKALGGLEALDMVLSFVENEIGESQNE